MKLASSVAIVLGFAVSPSLSFATDCEHYEYAELRAMSKANLELNYCLFEIRKSSLGKQRQIANEELILEAKYGRSEGPEAQRVRRKQETLSQASEACGRETGRFLSELDRKKGDTAALVKRCTTAPKAADPD